jgi:hypothetical protein
MEARMPWIVYETRCLVSGKIYIGVHKQDGDEFDGYLGSGNEIRLAVAEYGIANFERRTLFSFDNANEAYERESQLVTDDFRNSSDTYNIKRGGAGGFALNEQSQQRRARSIKKAWSRRGARSRQSIVMRGVMTSPEIKEKLSLSTKKSWASPEYRERIVTATREAYKRPEVIERVSKASMDSWRNPEIRERRIAGMRAAHAKRRAAKESQSVAEGTPARTDPCLGSSTRP